MTLASEEFAVAVLPDAQPQSGHHIRRTAWTGVTLAVHRGETRSWIISCPRGVEAATALEAPTTKAEPA